jgi:hypothetical protein
MFADYKELEKLLEQFQKVQKDVKPMMKGVLKYVAEDCLQKIKRDTPVDTGKLRESWTLTTWKQNEQETSVDIFSPLDYAGYVEDGFHTTSSGQAKRFIPGYWQGRKFIYDPNSETGMTVTRKFIDGKHMVRININKAELRVDNKFEQVFKRYLKKNGIL